jgi:hypothetical protein
LTKKPTPKPSLKERLKIEDRSSLTFLKIMVLFLAVGFLIAIGAAFYKSYSPGSPHLVVLYNQNGEPFMKFAGVSHLRYSNGRIFFRYNGNKASVPSNNVMVLEE